MSYHGIQGDIKYSHEKNKIEGELEKIDCFQERSYKKFIRTKKIT